MLPNTELGHLEIDGRDAETKTADSAREREDLTWEHWAHRLSKYLKHFEALLWPDLIILGGGVSKKAEKFLPFVVDVRTKVVTAQLAERSRHHRRSAVRRRALPGGGGTDGERLGRRFGHLGARGQW